MRLRLICLGLLASSLAGAQTLTKVYNRDTHVPFRLKDVTVESTVVGPLVKTSTLLTYENPYTTPTEATLNFDLAEASALGGFAYFYGDEYVQGQLMDKNKAWFIYTAITSRGRDPGIMEQWSPTDYHCQIFPIMQGRDLRVRLWTVGMLEPSNGVMNVPQVKAPRAVGYETIDGSYVKPNWTVRAVNSGAVNHTGDQYSVDLKSPVTCVAQRFKDGRIYVAGLIRTPAQTENTSPTFFKLRQPKTVQMDPSTLAFSGWVRRNQKIAARFNGIRYAFKPQLIAGGGDVAKLWAQQILATRSWAHRKDVLAFSLKYGVPSNATALLAVPAQEMKLFREKEKAYQQKLADERRQQLEAERERRNWAKQRNQNWNSSGGGDPEIRVEFPGAKSVEAILPDRRVIALKPDGDTWGGNFEIPADAPEGTYIVRVVAHQTDGTTTERSWTYEVDRTPPKGHAEILKENGKLILEVTSEAKLAEVAAYDSAGRKWVLHEEKPGVYRCEVTGTSASRLNIVMKDHAGNKGEFFCSLPR